jgi:FkbM family methyltransferase
MINMIRRLVPASIRRRAKQALGIPLTRLHPDWEVLRLIGPVDKAHVVLDAGAHHGWFFHCWLDWCPKGRIYAFEPTEESFRQAHKLYGADPRVNLFQVGLGARAENLAFNVLADSQVSNSFLPPRQATWQSIEYGTGPVFQRQVSLTTVDDFCAEHGLDSVYLLKIDVQGFELELLRGARGMLQHVQHVFVEAGIQRLYEGAPSFGDVCAFMEEQGFHLMHLRAWHRGNQVLVETDMLFRRNDLAPPIDRSRDRSYVELR